MSRRHHKRLRIQIKIGSHCLDKRLRNLVKLFNVSQNQCMLADQIDDSRDPAARAMDYLYRFIRKYPLGGARNE
jgi:hypothetical protein